jgi:hypothetical protein
MVGRLLWGGLFEGGLLWFFRMDRLTGGLMMIMRHDEVFVDRYCDDIGGLEFAVGKGVA